MNDWHLVHLGSFAKGGAGLVMVEATAVSAEGRITPYCAGLWNDQQIAPLKRINKFIHEHDSLSAIQLAHAGRKGSTFPPIKNYSTPRIAVNDERGWNVAGPSPIPFSEEYRSPSELSKHEIEEIINQFLKATERAKEADFDVVEIHAAHGYLLSSFYSPTCNQRSDEYGGDFNGRIKLLVDLVTAVRAIWEKPLFVRISAVEYNENGWKLEDSIELSKKLKELGVDLVDCSASGISSTEKVKVGVGYQVPFAEAIKRQANIATAAVGLITKAIQAEEIIFNERADIVAIGRELLRDPFWPLHAAKKLGLDVYWPPQYEWGVSR